MWLGHFAQSWSLIFSGVRTAQRTPRHHLLPRPVWPAAVVLVALHIPGMASAQITLSTDHGNSSDPLVSARPLFNRPGEVQATAVIVRAQPFGPQFTGAVTLSAECCKDAFTRNPVVSPDLSVEITCEVRGQLEPLGPRTDVVRPPGQPNPPTLPPPCQAAAGTAMVTIPSVGAEGRAVLRVITGPAAKPGAFIATVKGDSSLGTTSKEVFVSVIAAGLPPDGPFPGCVVPSKVGSVELLSLASITPDPFVWKRASSSNLDRTTYNLPMAFVSKAGAGLELTFSSLSPQPSDPTMSSISFTNDTGRWPVAVRTIDSRNCATPTQTVTVAAGETKSISFSAASTTTLVFSKSTCRVINVFDCWFRSQLGLDDIVVLSEGPFWTLFGGRMVSISTARDWAAIPLSDVIGTTP